MLVSNLGAIGEQSTGGEESAIVAHSLHVTAAATAMLTFSAWGVELTSDPDRRNLLFSINGVGSTLGLLFSAGVFSGLSSSLGQVKAARVMGVVCSASLVTFGIVGSLILPEAPGRQTKRPMNIIAALRSCWANTQWRVLLVINMSFSLLDELASIISYALYYVFRVDAPVWQGPLVITYSVVQVVGSLLLPPVAKRLGKKKTLRITCVLLVLFGAASLVTMLTKTLYGYFVAYGILGFALGFANPTTAAMNGDVVDIDEVALTGRRREGTYTAVDQMPGVLMKYVSPQEPSR